MNKRWLYAMVLGVGACAGTEDPRLEPSERARADAGVVVIASDARAPVDARMQTDIRVDASPSDAALAPSDAAPAPSDAAPQPSAPSDSVIVGYYPAWATYSRDYQVSEISAVGLTHINYAFANIQGGRCVLGDPWADVQKTFPGDNWDESSANAAGNFKQLRSLRAQNPSLRTLLSVGGWTWSSQFSDVALSEASRAQFASSCVDFMVEHGFDGLDIDWEYPVGGGLEGNVVRPVDRDNYSLLLRALRERMTAKQAELARKEAFLLTIAAPAGPAIIPNLDGSAIAQAVDWINVMAYDFHGTWDKRTGHNAPLNVGDGDSATGFSVRDAIGAYRGQGVPANKLVLGVPFYGRSFAGVGGSGLYQASTGAGPGTWENGVLDYQDLVAKYIGAAGYVRHEDTSAEVPYLFNAQTGVFISYDDPASLAKKAAYARSAGLRGTMIWDLSSDTADHALLSALSAP